MRRLLIGMTAVIVLVVLVVRFGSGTLAEKATRDYLEKRGIEVGALEVGHVSLRSASVNAAKIGAGDALTLEGLALHYRYANETMTPQSARADLVTLTLRTADGGFDIGGIETLAGLPGYPEKASDKPLVAHMSAALEAKMEAGRAAVKATDGTLDVKQGALSLKAEGLAVSVTPDAADRERMLWELAGERVQLHGAEGPLSEPLQLQLRGTFDGEALEGQGTLSDKGKTITMLLTLSHRISKKRSVVQWTSQPIVLHADKGRGFAAVSPLLAAIPPMDANLRMEGDVRLVAGKKPRLKHRIIIERAALSPLLKLVFKDDVAVTGEMKGEIPIHWAGEKIPQVKGVSLSNIAPGTLIYDPLTGASAALQGEAQAQILLDALRKFEYQSLTINADSDAEGVLKATFRLMGANPELYEGKPIDFTLNVNGNLLSILESQGKVHDVIEQNRTK